MDFELGSQVDLDAHEPLFAGEDDGLVVKGYEIDGEYVLDFDWDPESKWAFLEDEDAFREFTAGLISRLAGVEMTSVDIDALKIKHDPSSSLGTEESEDV